MGSEQLKNRALVADITRSFNNPRVGSLEAKAAFEGVVDKSARAAAAGLVAESERRKAAAADAAAHRKKMDESSIVVKKTRDEVGALWGGKRSRRVTAKRFCGCIKKVKSAKKKRTEGSSIAICTSSLLWPHGRTLHSVSCRRKASIKTQKRSAKSKK